MRKQECLALDEAMAPNDLLAFAPELLPELANGYFQVGTLGGGNHFIEIQEDDNGMVGIMLHSGSRNFGFKICKYFNNAAKELNSQWYTSVPAIENHFGKNVWVHRKGAIRARENDLGIVPGAMGSYSIGVIKG